MVKDGFIGVCVENNTNVVAFYEVFDLDDFLGDCEDRIPTYPPKLGILGLEYDSDRLVLELKNLKSLACPLTYLPSPQFNPNTLKPQWYYLKKHMPVVSASPGELHGWQNSLGHRLA